MKLSGLMGLAALAAITEALPAGDNSTSIEARGHGCYPPGEHKCAMVVWFVGVDHGVEIYSGTCHNIKRGGALSQNKKGYSGKFATSYGENLYFGAVHMGPEDDIDGVSYQYKGQSYTMTDCIGTGERLQCNFAC